MVDRDGNGIDDEIDAYQAKLRAGKAAAPKKDADWWGGQPKQTVYQPGQQNR